MENLNVSLPVNSEVNTHFYTHAQGGRITAKQNKLFSARAKSVHGVVGPVLSNLVTSRLVTKADLLAFIEANGGASNLALHFTPRAITRNVVCQNSVETQYFAKDGYHYFAHNNTFSRMQHGGYLHQHMHGVKVPVPLQKKEYLGHSLQCTHMSKLSMGSSYTNFGNLLWLCLLGSGHNSMLGSQLPYTYIEMPVVPLAQLYKDLTANGVGFNAPLEYNPILHLLNGGFSGQAYAQVGAHPIRHRAC